jgi:phosphatidylserine decarboxylase
MYAGGTMLVFRLTVDDYHHYCYVDDGIKTPNHHINGVFHTVNPIANDYYPIYKENTREYSLLKSKHFGDVLMMEVGALMVGKIVNYHNNADVKRGQEKGRFEFGGSTVVLCLQKGQAEIDNDIIANSAKGLETRVKLGEKIGYKTN